MGSMLSEEKQPEKETILKMMCMWGGWGGGGLWQQGQGKRGKKGEVRDNKEYQE